MPYRRRRYATSNKKKTTRKPVRKVRRIPRSFAPQNQHAKVVEGSASNGLATQAITSGLATPMIAQINGSFPRCSAMANLFSWYRITQIKYTFKPYSNTFQESATGPTIPEFYHIMDRSGSFEATSPPLLSSMVGMGAKPVKFTRQIVRKWKPNTLILSTTSASTGNITSPECKYDSWFSTAPITDSTAGFASALYYGAWFLVKQETGTTITTLGTYDVEIVCEFKEPRVAQGPA